MPPFILGVLKKNKVVGTTSVSLRHSDLMQDWKQSENAASTEWLPHLSASTRFDIEQDVATLAGNGCCGHGHSWSAFLRLAQDSNNSVMKYLKKPKENLDRRLAQATAVRFRLSFLLH